MACQAVNVWTFSELVAAFLDLSIAYCLLCASGFSFLASKFLALFGLCLPCPCDGQFWNPGNSNHCLQRQLVDCPREKISLVHSSARTKFPLERGWDGDDLIGNSNLKLVNGGNCENGNVELECGASSSSFKPGVEFGAVNLEASKEEECGLKGKRVVGRTLRRGLRRRRRGGSINDRKLPSVSSFDTLRSDARNTPQSPPSISKNGNNVLEDPNDFGGDREGPIDFGFLERASLGLELNDPNDGNKHIDGGGLVEESEVKELGDLGVDKNKEITVRLLEQALEEEHAARSALYLELEKERSAAASAADEAMAMMLRLQEEKASIEMEARQYQRMIEAKATYDAEEMNILKEIILRREREKHFLEKEVEAYRQMIWGNDQSDSDVQDVADTQVCNSTLSSREDPMLMLQQINDSIEEPKLKIVEGSSDYEMPFVKSLNRTLAFGKELAIPELVEGDESLKQVDVHGHTTVGKHTHFLRSNEMNHEFREKCVMFIYEKPVSQQEEVLRLSVCSKSTDLATAQVSDMHKKSVTPSVEELDETGSTRLCIDLALKASDFPYQENKDPINMVHDEESSVYDVHVVDDESKMLNAASTEKNERLSESATSNTPKKIGSLSSSALEMQNNASRSCSDITSALPPTGYSREKARVTDFRRNSMSAVDYERLKIDNEVEWLRERLRIVQKGREKLNFSVGHKEREKLQLQLLDNIVGQLREIRQLNEPGKAGLQASLPPSYSKVPSKKRRWRSASLNIHRST